MSDPTDLIEDEDGAPYPQCRWCPDQVSVNPDGNVAHVYQPGDDPDRRWWLFNCQRPYNGRYGVHRAEVEES